MDADLAADGGAAGRARSAPSSTAWTPTSPPTAARRRTRALGALVDRMDADLAADDSAGVELEYDVIGRTLHYDAAGPSASARADAASDGDASDGDASDGDASDGDASDGDASDGSDGGDDDDEDDEWQTDGSDYLDRVGRRFFDGAPVDGTITMWRPAAGGEPAVWHMAHDDGDEEDLEEHEVLRALHAFDEDLSQPPPEDAVADELLSEDDEDDEEGEVPPPPGRGVSPGEQAAIDDYVRGRPHLQPYRLHMDPALATRLSDDTGVSLPVFIVFPDDFWTLASVERERLVNIYRNQVALRGMNMGDAETDMDFLSLRVHAGSRRAPAAAAERERTQHRRQRRDSEALKRRIARSAPQRRARARARRAARAQARTGRSGAASRAPGSPRARAAAPRRARGRGSRAGRPARAGRLKQQAAEGARAGRRRRPRRRRRAAASRRTCRGTRGRARTCRAASCSTRRRAPSCATRSSRCGCARRCARSSTATPRAASTPTPASRTTGTCPATRRGPTRRSSTAGGRCSSRSRARSATSRSRGRPSPARCSWWRRRSTRGCTPRPACTRGRSG